MMKSSSRSVRRGLVLAAAALLTGAIAVAGLPSQRRVAARSLIRGYPMDPLASDLSAAESAFVRRAIDAGRLQLRLAELAAGHAVRSDVRGHAEQLKGDNRQLVEAFTALRQRKGMTSPAEVAETAAPDPYARLTRRPGAEFDREFVLLMAGLHEDTLSFFEQAASEARDPDVRDLAAAQLPMLRAHRNRITVLKQAFE